MPLAVLATWESQFTSCSKVSTLFPCNSFMGMKPSLSSVNSKAKHLTSNKPILSTLQKTNGTQGGTKSISSVNQSILQYTQCSDSKKLPMYCNFWVVEGGMSLTALGRLLWPCWQELQMTTGSNSQKISMGQTAINLTRNLPMFLNRFLTFHLFKWWSAVTGLPDHGWSFTSEFLPLSLDFLTQQHSYVHSICTIKGQSSPVNSWASKTQQLFTVWCTSTQLKMNHPLWT